MSATRTYNPFMGQGVGVGQSMSATGPVSPLAAPVTCLCGESACVCGVGEALIGPATVAQDGTVPLFWTHAQPSARLADVVAEFGTPSVLDTSPGGCAVWKSSQLISTPFTEVVMKDEEIPHCCPMEHRDFLYASTCINLDAKTQQAMLGITQSVWYDRLSHTLTARCHFMGAAVATLLLVSQVAMGVVGGKDAPKFYAEMIEGSKAWQEYAGMVNELAHNIGVLGGCTTGTSCEGVAC